MKISPFLQMLIGLLAGLLVPLLFGWLFLKNVYSSNVSFHTIFTVLKSTSLLMKLLFVAVLPNMLAVFLLNQFEKWNYCRGVFVSIMIYIVVAVLIET